VVPFEIRGGRISGTQLLVGGSKGAIVQQGAGMSAFPGRNFMSRKFTILFLSATFLVALATLALRSDGAFAGDARVNSELENHNGGALGGPKNPTSPGGPKKQDQSTTVNTSRSNIKNNMGVMGGGGGPGGGAQPGGGGRRQ
jgi:hypothetical protein